MYALQIQNVKRNVVKTASIDEINVNKNVSNGSLHNNSDTDDTNNNDNNENSNIISINNSNMSDETTTSINNLPPITI
jgi:hypothetical protein